MLCGLLYPGPDGVSGPGFVVAHGFTNHVRRPAVRRVLETLASRGPVLALDFRGHGRSGGRSSIGITETEDLTAVIGHLRRLGCDRVVTVGFSMGGAVVLRQAALSDSADRPDAVVAVSSPTRWWVRETAPMRLVHWLLEQPHGRWCARLIGVRLGAPWTVVPPSPVEVVSRIAPTPVLFVHGECDHYFPASEASALHEACGSGELWREPGMRHAESGTTPGLADRIAAWAVDTVAGLDRAARSFRPSAPTERTSR
jgi:pimeloyl-ACP methyl ester carboxylesterase